MDDPDTFVPVQPRRELGRAVGREGATGRTRAGAVSSGAAHGREVANSRPATHGPVDREVESGEELLPAPWGDDGPVEDLVPRVFAPLKNLRPSRDSNETTHDRINWAIHAAYTTPDGVWRKANILYAYTIGPVLITLGDLIRWVGGSLARFLGALVIVPSLLFVLNQLPVLDWLIPDQFDVSSLFAEDDPDAVVVPIVPPPPGGVG